MFKLFKDNFKTTHDCIILATPLIIFLSILGWYISYAITSVDNIPKLILAIVTTIVMFSGFLSAWLYMVKKTLSLSRKIFVFDKDRGKALLNLLLSLPKGIGKLFLPTLAATTIYLILFIIIVICAKLIIDNFIGSINLENIDLNSFFVSSKELIAEARELPKEELLTINCWYAIISTGITFVSFITILWIPEIVYCEKRPLKALYNSIIKLITTFPKTLLLFVYIYFLTIVISILNTLLMFNPFTYFFILILYYYFLVYIVVLLFSYYEQNFIN